MALIIALMGCGEAIYVDESTIDFPIFLLFFNTKFPIFPIFSIPSFLFSSFFLSNQAAGHPEKTELMLRLSWSYPPGLKTSYHALIQHSQVVLKFV